jgi:hypothetical protein
MGLLSLLHPVAGQWCNKKNIFYENDNKLIFRECQLRITLRGKLKWRNANPERFSWELQNLQSSRTTLTVFTILLPRLSRGSKLDWSIEDSVAKLQLCH